MKYLITLVSALFIAFQGISQSPLKTAHFTGTGDNYAHTSILDSTNNLYVIGQFTSTVNQKPGQGLSKTLTSKGGTDIFVAKYDNNLQLVWLRQVGGTGTEQLSSYITFDKDQKTLWIGFTTQSLTCTDENNTLVSAGSTSGQDEIVIASINPATGDFTFGKKLSLDATLHRISSLNADSSNNIIVSGYFSTKIKFTATDSLVKVYGNYNSFVAKFDKNGNYKKSVQLVGNPTFINSVSILSGSTYVISGTVNNILKVGTDSLYNSTSVDIILVRIDSSMKYVAGSLRRIFGPGTDNCLSVSNDKNKNVYISGFFNSDYLSVDSTSTLTVEKGNAGKKINKGTGTNDFLFAKYDSVGVLKWFNYGGTSEDDRMSRIASNDNSVMIAGRFGTPKVVFKNDSINNSSATGNDGLTIIMDKYNNLIYLIGYGGTGTDLIQTGVITSLGNFIVIGDFTSPQVIVGKDTMTNPAATKDVAIIKYSKASLTMWKTNIVCPNGSDGSVAALPKGTTMAPYSFKWTKKGDGTFNKTDQYIYNLNAGTYYVEFTDNLGFKIYDSVVMTNPATPAIAISVTSVTDPACNGGSDGKINISPSGGYGSFTYNWVALSGSGLIPTNQNQSTLSKGTYKVTVTDVKGCKATSNNIGVNEPAAISLTAVPTDVTAPGGSDGSVVLTVTNGTSPFTFAWTKVGDIAYSASTQDISLLKSGIYNLSLTDNKSCHAGTSATVREPNSLFVTLSTTPISCYDSADGSITAVVTNGNGTYTYTWTKVGSAGFSAPNSATISNLDSGTYNLSVTDGTKSGSGQTQLIEPTKFVIGSVPVTNIFCYGTATGSIDVSLSGGTLPYSYSWTKTGDISFTATSANLIEVIAGQYSYIATDARGCTQDTTVQITQIDSMIIISDIQPVSCAGETYDGFVHQSVSGGNGTFNYIWSTGMTSQNIDFLKPGSYYCTVSDIKSCQVTKRYIVDEPGVIFGSFVTTAITCYGKKNGTAEIKLSGGNQPYTYRWKSPITDTVAKASGLNKGTYTVHVKDSKKCEAEFTMPTAITEPDTLVMQVDSVIKEISGNDGKIYISATGGSTPYNFLILPLGTNNTNGQFLNLAPKKYMVYLTDKNLCGPLKTDSLTIEAKPIKIPTILDPVSIVAYPNPNVGVFTAIINASECEYLISMVNSTGQVVYNQRLFPKDNVSEVSINVPYLPKGIYFLKVNNFIPVKIVIQ